MALAVLIGPKVRAVLNEVDHQIANVNVLTPRNKVDDLIDVETARNVATMVAVNALVEPQSRTVEGKIERDVKDVEGYSWNKVTR